MRRKKPRLSVATGGIDGEADRPAALTAWPGVALGVSGAAGLGVGAWVLLADGAEWDLPPEERTRTRASAHGTSIATMATTASVPTARHRTLNPPVSPTGILLFLFRCPRPLSGMFRDLSEDAHVPTSSQRLPI